VHLIGFIIRIYHDARSPERHFITMHGHVNVKVLHTHTHTHTHTHSVPLVTMILTDKNIYEPQHHMDLCDLINTARSWDKAIKRSQ